MKVLITGGCGFIGSHFVEHFLKETDWDIVVWDKLTYASMGYDRLRDIECFDESRVKVYSVDLGERVSEGIRKEVGYVDYIINLASESHVDNSISDPVPFVKNNIDLCLNLYEFARDIKPKKIIQFGTDEVYGAAPQGVDYKEGDRYNAGNPYSASKAAQDALATAYSNTYNLPVVITNTMNIFGERQHSEKFIPICIRKILHGEQITIHSDAKKEVSGTRYYLHARNAAKAVHFILSVDEGIDKHDASLGKWNIVGDKEISNLDMAQFIADYMDKELKYEMVDFHSSRPGHDLRYSLDGSKLKYFGFEYPKTFEESLKKTIDWYLEHKQWL